MERFPGLIQIGTGLVEDFLKVTAKVFELMDLQLEHDAVTFPLRRSVSEQPQVAAEENLRRAMERRLRYGAPSTPGEMVPERIVDRLLQALPFDKGMITPTLIGVRVPSTSDAVKQEGTDWIPRDRIVYYEMLSLGKIREILMGRLKQRVVLLREGENYVVLEGGEYVFANDITQIPAVKADLVSAEELIYAGGANLGPTQDMIYLAKEIREALKEWTYGVPSKFEPLAKIAREVDEDGFVALMEGLPTEEEKVADYKADEAFMKSVKVWAKVFEEYAREMKEDKAREETEKSLEWKKEEERAVKLLERGVKIKERWDVVREEVQQAQREALEWDGEEWDKPGKAYVDWRGFYELARRGVPTPMGEDILTKSFGGLYERVGSLEGFVAKEDIKDVYLLPGSIAEELERNLVPYTEQMNRVVLGVDYAKFQERELRTEQEVAVAVDECSNIVGREFNPTSRTDCVKEFFEVRKLPVQRVSGKTQAPSCDEDTLQVFADMGDGLALKVIEARKLKSKLSQLGGWRQYAEAGKVQSKWNSMGTPMGRYTSESPNLQNRIQEIRETVMAPTGYTFVSLDLGQAEYVTWASLSKDPTLMAIFEKGEDLHQVMFDAVKEAVPTLDTRGEEPRRVGKMINFAILYGMLPFTLGKKLGTTTEVATAIIEAYRARGFVAVQYKERILQEALKRGFVETYFGRVRRFPDLPKMKGTQLQEVKKTIWHHHNSGTAAEVLKLKTILTMRKVAHLNVKCALNMHDELVTIVQDDQLEEARDLMVEAFSEPLPNFLPYKVTVDVGKCWGDVTGD